MRTSKQPLRGPDGRVVGVLGTYEDITAYKRAEEVVRASEARQTYLLRLSDALRPAADPAAVQDVVCRILAGQLRADRAYYCEVDEPAGRIRVTRDVVRPGVPSLAGDYPLAALPVGAFVAVPLVIGRHVRYSGEQQPNPHPRHPEERRHRDFASPA